MNKRLSMIIILLLLGVIGYLGSAVEWGRPPSLGGGGAGMGGDGGGDQSDGSSGGNGSNVSGARDISGIDTRTPQEKRLAELTEEMVSELQADDRLSLNMVPQLRVYRDMLALLEDYAGKVENDIEIIKEITTDEFQEDVKLQAALFAGKKADLVAKHLEEFRAGRVGAILSKMKEKEASSVLDVWAKAESSTVSNFYRQVVSAYLKNKRRDMHPEIFDRFKEATANSDEGKPAQ